MKMEGENSPFDCWVQQLSTEDVMKFERELYVTYKHDYMGKAILHNVTLKLLRSQTITPQWLQDTINAMDKPECDGIISWQWIE